jgi:hypothetical protein
VITHSHRDPPAQKDTNAKNKKNEQLRDVRTSSTQHCALRTTALLPPQCACFQAAPMTETCLSRQEPFRSPTPTTHSTAQNGTAQNRKMQAVRHPPTHALHFRRTAHLPRQCTNENKYRKPLVPLCATLWKLKNTPLWEAEKYAVSNPYSTVLCCCFFERTGQFLAHFPAFSDQILKIPEPPGLHSLRIGSCGAPSEPPTI